MSRNPIRRPLRRLAAAGAVLSCALMLQGCAAGIGLTLLGVGAGTATSAGVNHTLGGIAYKTFTAPADEVHAATRDAFATMGIKVASDEAGENGARAVKGSTNDRDISVDIEPVTERTTRIRVVASEDLVFKDSATATELIMQTARSLDVLQAAAPTKVVPATARRAKPKNTTQARRS